jgi:DHA1 family multidrug resistance protein-like MFS transporter
MWKRNLAIIWVTELIAIAGFSITFPILPLYVRELGTHDETSVKLWSGLIFSAPAVTMALFGPIWGALSDRYGRKVMVERAMIGGAILIALMGLVRNVQQLAILRTIQGALTGTVTAATTLVATSVPRERSGYALGLLQMSIYSGASVGPLLGGAVSDAFGYRTAFWVTGALLMVAGITVLLFVEETFEPAEQETTTGLAEDLRRQLIEPLLSLTRFPTLRGVLTLRLLSRLAGGMLSPVLPFIVEELAGGNAPVGSVVGTFNGAGAAAGAIGALALGRLADRIGYRRVLLGCTALATLGYCGQFFAHTIILLGALHVLNGLAMGGIIASISASLAALAPEGQEGIVYGLSSSVGAGANALAPAFGSLLAIWPGLRAPFVTAAAVFILMAGVTVQSMPARVVVAEAVEKDSET